MRAVGIGILTCTIACGSSAPARPTAAPAVVAVPPPPAVSTALPRTWTFDEEAAGQPATGFELRFPSGDPDGEWLIGADEDAPSGPNVLVQREDNDGLWWWAVAFPDAPPIADFRLSVRCKLVGGKDRACGLVFRVIDGSNHYITLANAAGYVGLYVNKGGRAWRIARATAEVSESTWHHYVVEARGDHIEVFWDGKKVIDVRDEALLDPGRVGLWTSSVTSFDDLSLTPP